MQVSFWQIDGQLVRANRQTSAVWVTHGKVLPWVIHELHLPIRTFSPGRACNTFVFPNRLLFFLFLVFLSQVHTSWCMLVCNHIVKWQVEIFLFGSLFLSMKNPIRQNALQLIASLLRKKKNPAYGWLWHTVVVQTEIKENISIF